jgi:hypothetical protein
VGREHVQLQFETTARIVTDGDAKGLLQPSREQRQSDIINDRREGRRTNLGGNQSELCTVIMAKMPAQPGRNEPAHRPFVFSLTY